MIRGLLSSLSELIYPNLCIGCLKQAPLQNAELCLSCQLGIPRIDVLKDSESYLIGKSSFPKNVNFFSYFYFVEGNVAQKIIHSIKYHKRSDLAKKYGELLGREIVKMDWTNFCIVPVPIHPAKEHKRGYNQAEQIGIGISQALKIPVIRNMLVRTINEKSQTTKSKHQRQEIKLNSFRMNPNVKGRVDNILLIDDVVTTGSTIAACLSALNQQNLIETRVASLAIAV